MRRNAVAMRKQYDKKRIPAHYSLSVIVPAYNEVDNIEPLAREFDDFLSGQRFRAEVIVVDDGSTDGTADKVLELSEKYDFLKLIRHKHNLGKTAAINSGFTASRGKRVCIFDADLQYDPRDIKRMMDKLDRGFGIVAGIKKGKYQKPFISKIYNGLTRRLFGIKVKDMNSLKLLRRDVMADIFLRKDWHRFMVVLAAQRGYKIAEVPVTLRQRKFGESKYGGVGRVFIGLTDLIAVWLAERVFKKPMLIFGSFGVVSLGLGFFLALFILVVRLFFDWGYPPLQTILILLVLLGGISLTLGFLAEAIANLRDRIEFLMAKSGIHETPHIETARSSKSVTSKKSAQKKQPERRESYPKKRPGENSRSETQSKNKGFRSEKTERHREQTEPQTEKKSSSIEVLPHSEEPSWGRRGKRTKTTVTKGIENPDVFKNVVDMARKKFHGSAYTGKTTERTEDGDEQRD